MICKALLNYGFDKFSLEILEYCDPKFCIQREQYYIDLFKPEYNILPTAGSNLGFKHSEETLNKMKGREFSIETLAKMSIANKGNKNPMFGRTGIKHPMYGKVKPTAKQWEDFLKKYPFWIF